MIKKKNLCDIIADFYSVFLITGSAVPNQPLEIFNKPGQQLYQQ